MAPKNNENGDKGGAPPPPPKIVGPNITGKREEYRLERRLQSGLFGGVYEAKGLSSGRMFAVKVLHRSELHKAARASSLEFCEVPLSEVKFSDVMRGHEHVMQVEDHFEDQYCHYIVFELARGGDLLEALKLKPNGFEEAQAQFLIGQAARGLACLHDRRLAMQDVSLENMLLHVLDNGEYQVKICDPGQAVLFDLDAQTGEEIPVNFHGFVGKSFRPPEIHRKQPYLSTQVDAWCLGWSTFYLLAAQPLFLSADPAQQDPDWELFERSEYATLFRQKATSCSQQCIDFILKLLHIDPKRRMTVSEALQHEWLRDSNAKPMYAPKEIMPPLPLPQTPDKRDAARPTETEYVRPPPGSINAEAGIASPTVGGGLNGHVPMETQSKQGLNQGMSGGYRGGQLGSQAGSLGGTSGLSAGGHFSSGGGPGGLGTAGGPDWQGRRSGAYSGLAPAWKMAPPSRSESPGPGSSNPSLLGRPGYYQGAGSAGTPTPNQYAPMQARTSSPFGSAPRGPGGYVPLQRRSPSPPPRQGASLLRGNQGTNVYGGPRDWNELGSQNSIGNAGGSQNSHTPRPARTSALGGPGQGGSNRGLLTAGGGQAAADEYGNAPQPQLSAAAMPEGLNPDGSASQTDGNGGDPRFANMDIMGGSGRHASAAGNSLSGNRTSSPMPQNSVILRPQNVRGLSPSPMRNLAGLDASWIQQRSGSPMGGHPTGLSGSSGNLQGSAAGATRGISGQPIASLDATAGGANGSQFWQSPRTASPSASVFRQPQNAEAYSRGRSQQRALSPSQTGGLSYGVNPGAVGQMRTLSPNGGAMPGRAGAGAGIAWSPVPPSPPAPKRSISPQPTSIVVAGHNNSVSSLRWVG